jgi:hypothetical protein
MPQFFRGGNYNFWPKQRHPSSKYGDNATCRSMDGSVTALFNSPYTGCNKRLLTTESKIIIEVQSEKWNNCLYNLQER